MATSVLVAAPIYDALSALAGRLRSDRSLQAQALAATSLDAFQAALEGAARETGIALDSDELAHHLELLTSFEPPYYFSNPRVGLDIGALPPLLKWRITVAWLAAEAASWLDSPPFYGSRFWWLRRPTTGPEGDGDRAAMLRHYSAPEQQAMRAKFTALGEDYWRHFIDWEDQDFGPLVYDQQLHERKGTEAEPGYLEQMRQVTALVVDNLGQCLSGESYEHLHHLAVDHLDGRSRRYSPCRREFWRPRDWTDPDFLDDIDPGALRLYKHRYFEVLAFRHLNLEDQEAFKRENFHFAELFLRKYGHLNPSVRLLNREFARFRVNYFDRPYTDEMVLDKIDASFVALYGALQALQEEEDARRENEPDELEWRADLEQRRLLELAKWHKTIEYLRPYDEGNTRASVLVLNKILVELGFVPTILEQQNDAPFRSNRGWRRNIITGMQRWQAIRLFRDMGLLPHLLSFRFQAEPRTTSIRASAICAPGS